MKNAKKAHIKKEKELDKLWSKAVRTRDKYACQKCGKVNKRVHAAHIYSRIHKNTRWDTKNGITLCHYCHIFWSHRQPVEFTEWIKEKIGTRRFNSLKKKSDTLLKNPNYSIIKRKLCREYAGYTKKGQ